MKRKNLFGKATLCLAAVSMTMFLFAGCGSNSSSTSQPSSNNTQSSSSSTQNDKQTKADQRKKQIQDAIQPLVTAGTITQDQSTKIVDALTTRPTGDKQNKSQDKQQNNGQNNNQNKQRNNPLSKLVSDGTITQAQSDAVMQKLKGMFSHKNNGQDSQNNSNQSSN